MDKLTDIELEWLLLATTEYFKEFDDGICRSLHFVKYLKDVTGYSLVDCKKIWDLLRETNCVIFLNNERFWHLENIKLITDINDLKFLFKSESIEKLKYYKNLNLI